MSDSQTLFQDYYTNQLINDNKKLEEEIQEKEKNLRIYNRINDYYSQDEVMLVFIQKILTILYVVIYFIFIYFLYSNENTVMSVLYLIIFAVLPFTLHIVSRFLYKTFLQILHLFNNGNAAYLYTVKQNN
jgi:FlaA1/EpsC-like NDP-sugar epimerase